MTSREAMINSPSLNNLQRLVIMPVLMGLGHLAPAIGAIHTVTGTYQFPGALLGMIATGAALVDSYDTYKDVPIPNRPPKWIWNIWFYSLWTMIIVCTIYSGFKPAIVMYRFALLGLGWGTPCVPYLIPKCGLRLYKPKDILREAKSLVVAICMAYVTAETSMVYFCGSHKTTTTSAQCSEQSLRSRILGLTILYQFFRETVCDTRDIAEDTQDGMKTLPMRLGKKNTLCLMGILGSLVDASITGGISMSGVWGFHLDYLLLSGAVLRVGVTVLFYSIVLEQPRGNVVAWDAASLIGLAPVIWAQQSLKG